MSTGGATDYVDSFAPRGLCLKTTPLPGLTGLLPNSATWLVSDPCRLSAAVPLTRGTLKPAESKSLISPPRGRAAKGGRGRSQAILLVGQHALTPGASICGRSAAQQGRGFRRDITFINFITTTAIWTSAPRKRGKTTRLH